MFQSLFSSLIFSHLLLASLCLPVRSVIVQAGLVEMGSVDSTVLIADQVKEHLREEPKDLLPQNDQDRPLCFLHPDAAIALQQVQQQLQASGGYGLKLVEGYHPPMNELDPKSDYLPFNIQETSDSHSRGISVVVTLLHKAKEVDMPTPLYTYNEKTHRGYEALSEEVLFNRTLLEHAMLLQGFEGCPKRWWHFTLAGKQRYPVLTIPVETLVAEYHKQMSQRQQEEYLATGPSKPSIEAMSNLSLDEAIFEEL